MSEDEKRYEPHDFMAICSCAQGKDSVTAAQVNLGVILDVLLHAAKHQIFVPNSYPCFGPVTPELMAGRVLAAMLDWGWTPPPDDRWKTEAERFIPFVTDS